MKIAVRVDASYQIGTGHFMRCLTLADALQKRGAQVRFVSRHLPVYLQDMLKGKGHQFVLLQSKAENTCGNGLAHAHWLGTGQLADVQDSIGALSDQKWDWMVVDHYSLDIVWESQIRLVVPRIFVIDDIADRCHDCNVLLDQNFYENIDARYLGKVPERCVTLLGPQYALLRDEFSQLHQLIRPRTGPVRRILVFFGGVDADNYTGRAVKALAGLSLEDVVVDVVIGAQHPCREQIRVACSISMFNFYVQTDQLAELMSAADISIGAGGSATWERCCLGLPVLVMSLANNQIEIAKAVGLLGIGQYLASDVADDVLLFRNAILDLLKSSKRLLEFSKNAHVIVDGLGIERVCKVLEY